VPCQGRSRYQAARPKVACSAEEISRAATVDLMKQTRKHSMVSQSEITTALKCSTAVGVAALTLTIVLVPVRSKAAGDEISHRIDQIYTDCAKEWEAASPIATCILEREKEYGNELERLYKRLLKGPAPNVAILRRQQRNWLKYQKQHCDTYYDLQADEGQGFARLSSAKCLLRTTLQRVEELRELLP